jgi:predicted metal-dependent HD superfamily phosphohydrolase
MVLAMAFDLPAALLERAKRAYLSPPRAYHCWEHIEELERRYREVEAGPGWKRPREAQLAAIFHDAIYVAGAKDNEHRSAQLATAEIKALLPNEPIDTARVEQLILLTARHGALQPSDVDPEAALFLDCDMAILAADPAGFERYDAQIREEYSAVPSVLYALGRRRFLTRLLDTPRIYLSDFFHARLDAAARRNLQRALA